MPTVHMPEGCDQAAQGRSIMEMLPAYETPIPHAKGNTAKKNFWLREAVCSQCGGAFILRRGARGYVRHVNGRDMRLCSWSCLCRFDEAQQEAARRKTLQHIEDMHAKARADRRLLDSEAGAAMSDKEKKAVQHRLAWRLRRAMQLEVELTLESLLEEKT